MKCKEHPRYMAKRKPSASIEYPFGCPACWAVWDKSKAGTVNVALSVEEARVAVVALHSIISSNPALQQLFQALVQATKEMV
jgi:hypothetical protein